MARPELVSEAVALLPAFGGSRRCVNTGNARRRHSEPGQHGSVIANVFPKTFPYQKPALLPDSLRGSEPTRIFGKPSLWSAGLRSSPAPGAEGEGGWGLGDREARPLMTAPRAQGQGLGKYPTLCL